MMLILITRSELFTADPDRRFAREYRTDEGLWKEMWRRHSILEYSYGDMAEYFQLKTGRKISNQNVKRWANRTRVFIKAKPVLEMGCESVHSYFFEELEGFVIKELVKNLRSSVKRNPRTMP